MSLERMKEGGGPAFPQPAEVLGRGMSLRDYFAAAALQGMLANSAWTNRPDKVDGEEQAAAYAHADAMLVERAKKT